MIYILMERRIIMAYADAKICCNCQYWDGPRKVSAFKKMSEVKTMSDQGVCLNRRAVNTKGRPQRAGQPSTCGVFEKWDELT